VYRSRGMVKRCRLRDEVNSSVPSVILTEISVLKVKKALLYRGVEAT